jgi:prepilin-type processing-associated H-X9-DG protein
MFGVFAYANDNKGDGPMRGWFTYTVAERPREALGWGGQPSKVLDPMGTLGTNAHLLVNLGMLWPKWIGRQQNVLYCPKNDKVRDDPNSGWPAAFKSWQECYWVYGGYNYCATLARRGDPTDQDVPGKSPNFRGANPFPKQVWASGFDSWVNNVWKRRNNNALFKMPVAPCLVSDTFIGGFTPPHSNGKSVNVAYTDGHVRNQLITNVITSGNSYQYEAWWQFCMKQ